MTRDFAMDGKPILLVGPDFDVHREISDILDQNGYLTRTVTRPEEAAVSMEEAPAPVVIVELAAHLPQFARLATDIRERFPRTELIVLAGLSNLHEALAAVEEGAAGYLLKPVMPHDLLKMVKRAIERGRNLDGSFHPETGGPNDSAPLLESHHHEAMLPGPGAAQGGLYQFLQAMADRVPGAVALINTGGEVVAWNRRATELSGYNALGKGWRQCVRQLLPDRRQRHRMLRQVRKALATELEGQTRLEISLAGKPGTSFFDLFALRPAPGGAPALLLVGEFPGSGHHTVAESVRGLKDPDSMEITSDLAHQLNNPLAALLVAAELLQCEDSSLDVVRNRVRTLIEEARRTSDIVRRTLAVLRQPNHPTVVADVHEVIRRVILEIEESLRASGTKLTLRLVSSPSLVLADAELLHDTLLILLRKLQPQRGEPPQEHHLVLRTHHSRRSFYVVVEVPESCMPPGAEAALRSYGNLDRASQPPASFQKIESTLESVSGDLRVSSLAQGMVAVIVRLPLPELKGRSTLRRASRRPYFQGKSVLVVDDEEVILDLLEAVLARWGLEVEVASDGNEALHKIRRRSFDLILSDIKMPNLDGKALYAAVRKMRPRLARRIIFSTGDTASEATAGFLENVGNPYLTKPFDMEDLKLTIARMLDDTRAVESGSHE